jgi:LysM repeat protein
MLFNDLNWESKLEAGDRLYVDQKKNRGEDKSTVVKVDETMHDISQREQIKLSKLYRINDFKMGYQPMTGDTIFLRKSFFSKKM